MIRIAALTIIASFLAISTVTAQARKTGIGDPTIMEHSRVKVHQRYPGDTGQRNPDAGYKYREKCHWYFKTTDGWWWPTQPTQKCVRVN